MGPVLHADSADISATDGKIGGSRLRLERRVPGVRRYGNVGSFN